MDKKAREDDVKFIRDRVKMIEAEFKQDRVEKDRFKLDMEDFYLEAVERLASYDKWVDDVEQTFTESRKWFGQMDLSLEEYFETWDQFLAGYLEAEEKVEKLRKEKEKKEALEQRKRERELENQKAGKKVKKKKKVVKKKKKGGGGLLGKKIETKRRSSNGRK